MQPFGPRQSRGLTQSHGGETSRAGHAVGSESARMRHVRRAAEEVPWSPTSTPIRWMPPTCGARVQRCVDDRARPPVRRARRGRTRRPGPARRVASLLTGGKRLRAAFLYWGYRATGQPDGEAIVRVATAMEFFQAAALIHDDVMDDSDTRRGMPAAHRSLAARHEREAWSGDAGPVRGGRRDPCRQPVPRLDRGPLRDLGTGLGPPREGRAVFDIMRTQLMGGQFLDVVESARSWDGVSHARADRARRARDPVQERQVHRRAPPAHRGDRRRRQRRGPRSPCPATASTSVRPSQAA